MTEMRSMLDEFARQAKTYDVVERAYRRSERQRRLMRVAGGTTAAVLASAAGFGGAALAGVFGASAPIPDGQAPTATLAELPPAALPTIEPAPPFPTSCSAQRLPLPAGLDDKSVVSGGDPTGRYLIGIGFHFDSQGGVLENPLLWDNGQVIEIPVPGVGEPRSVDVNTSGDVIIVFSGDVTDGYYYHDGTLTQLAGSEATPVAINDGGEVVGSVGVPSGESTGGSTLYTTRPAVWHTPTAQPELLGPDDLQGTAIGIDDDGTVTVAVNAGAHLDGAATLERFTPDGSAGAVGLPAPNDFRGFAYAEGWLEGFHRDGGAVGPVWHISAPDQVVDPGFLFGGAMNGHGWVAGGTDLTPPVLWSPDGTSVELPSLTGSYSDHPADDLNFVSDDGHIVAGQVDAPATSTIHDGPIAVVWHCS
ncbi:MAG TPA: hypothetical protein VH561_17100 [Micromonosporaceae bacterium]|jgi:hypothetical protein